MSTISFTQIGTIYTPHKKVDGMPIQPLAANGVEGRIKILPEFASGLKDLDGFSHIILIYHLHKVNGYELEVIPFMDTESHGIFATRSPKRPNAIGLSTVKLLRVEGDVIYFDQADMLDETPLLDIKPYFEKFDNRENTRSGWLEKTLDKPANELLSDRRFE